MDEDEVTREPFEDQDNDEDDAGSLAGDHQSKYDSNVPEHGKHNDLETSDATLINQDEDDASSVCAEDIDYAKTFGIQLRGSKIRTDYQRLMNSDLFDSKESKAKSDATKADDKKEPAIKTSTTSDCIYHKGCFYQKGDIVALCDQDDGQVYFAQLTGFLQDQYCEKSASVNWLVPTRPTSRQSFDPSAYRIGLEDEQLRKLDCMTFVCRCPHDYYLRKFFQPNSQAAELGESLETNYKKSNRNQTYIWTTMKPCSVPTIETRASEC